MERESVYYAGGGARHVEVFRSESPPVNPHLDVRNGVIGPGHVDR
jgi:hypothetical protein